MGRDGVPVALPPTLIPGIPDQGWVVRKADAGLTEQFQVLPRPSTGGSAQNALGHGAEHELKFQGVPFFLPALPGLLLFLGRSQDISEASTATMLYTVCAACSTRFLGI